MKKAEMNFMLNPKTMITKSTTDAALNRVELVIFQNDCVMAAENYRRIINEMGLTFNNEKTVSQVTFWPRRDNQDCIRSERYL